MESLNFVLHYLLIIKVLIIKLNTFFIKDVSLLIFILLFFHNYYANIIKNKNL